MASYATLTSQLVGSQLGNLTTSNTTNILTDDLELENVVTIDIPELDKSSVEIAERMVRDMEGLYYDEEWMAAHPHIKRRVNIELESLRSLIKLRKANEQAHDAILNGISADNTNASLYRALGEIQRTSLAVTKQINELIQGLDNILKQYQWDETTERPSPENDEDDGDQQMHRGSKSFIKEQIKRSE